MISLPHQGYGFDMPSADSTRLCGAGWYGAFVPVVIKNAVLFSWGRREEVECNSYFSILGFRLTKILNRIFNPDIFTLMFYDNVVINYVRSISHSCCFNLQGKLIRGNAGIDCRSDESTESSEKCQIRKCDFPPWRFAMAALAGFFLGFWGYWNLRRGQRQSIATLVFFVGTCLWAYAVHGVIIWSVWSVK
jgi:hypothetical protein